MSRWHVFVWGALGVALVGCQEPTEILPATPPGGTIDRMPEHEKGDSGPQALGEQVMPKNKAQADEPITPAKPTEPGKTITTDKGLKYETLKPGTGDEVKSGQTVVMTYKGTLDDGSVFDQKGADSPFETVIGTGQVIKGWDQGVVGMLVGEKRKLIIPAELAYGQAGRPGIPANSQLTFEVEVLKIK